MTTEDILARIREYHPEVLTADGFDEAILGMAEGWFGDHPESGSHHHSVVAYDYAKCVEILVGQGMPEEEAEEYLSFNTLGAYVGEFTPVFLFHWRAEES